jgi:hypothetical protein
MEHAAVLDAVEHLEKMAEAGKHPQEVAAAAAEIADGWWLERFPIMANQHGLDSQDFANGRISLNNRFAGNECLAPILLICESALSAR